MISIILGAGASNGCVAKGKKGFAPPSGEAPPLSNQLFDYHEEFREILHRYNKANPVMYKIKSALFNSSEKTSLESELESYAIKKQYLGEMISIKFYLRDLFQKISNEYLKGIIGSDNYSGLVHFLKGEVTEPVTFITFNYDTLLELAMGEMTGYKFRSIDDYLRSGPYTVLKLHGSCNWYRPLFNWELQESPYEYFSRGKQEEPNRGLYQVMNAGDENPSYPAIGLPLTTKTEEHFECPEEMLDQAKKAMQETTKLVIIGWKGREDHFNRSVLSELNKNASIQIVSQNQSSAKEIGGYITGYQDLHSFRDRIQYPTVSGFSGYVASKNEMTFLSS